MTKNGAPEEKRSRLHLGPMMYLLNRSLGLSPLGSHELGDIMAYIL
jgi:hypothetical protein